MMPASTMTARFTLWESIISRASILVGMLEPAGLERIHAH